MVLLSIGILRVTGCAERLFYVPATGPTPAPTAVVPGAKRLAFASADGTPLVGWLLPARGSAPEAAPTVLHVHGNAGNMNDHLGFSGWLTTEGINVVLFDYRGYGESGGRARRREPLVADAAAALDALLDLPEVDRARVGLFGQSLGGAIGLNLMADRAELQAGVVLSAFTSWRDAAAGALGGDPPPAWARLLARALLSDGLRPDAAIARIERPLLLVHGTADEIIPVAQSRRLAAAAPQGTLLEIPGADHNGLLADDPATRQRIAAFLHASLGGHRE